MSITSALLWYLGCLVIVGPVAWALCAASQQRERAAIRASLAHQQRDEWRRGVEQSCVREWPIRRGK